jgi:hypothetical protein
MHKLTILLVITLLTLSSVSAQFRKTAHQPRHRQDLAGFIGALMRFDSAGIFAASGLKFHQMPALFSVIRLLFMAFGEFWFAERVRPIVWALEYRPYVIRVLGPI